MRIMKYHKILEDWIKATKIETIMNLMIKNDVNTFLFLATWLVLNKINVIRGYEACYYSLQQSACSRG